MRERVEIVAVVDDGDKPCDRSGTSRGANALGPGVASATLGAASGTRPCRDDTRSQPPPLVSRSRVEKIDLR